jgi:predicted nicotinamide N-methyase
MKEMILSEVHAEKIGPSELTRDFEAEGHSKTVSSLFFLKFSFKDTQNNECDKDGDLVLVRKPNKSSEFPSPEIIKIYHQMSTDLEHVGLQLWEGSLLLADFILDNPTMFKQKQILEIGCGLGFLPIVLNRIGDFKHIKATDKVPVVLKLAKRNYLENLMPFNGTSDNVEFSEFDLISEPNKDTFGNDLFDIILAADICYSPDITEALILHMKHLVRPNTCMFVAVKQRLVYHLTESKQVKAQVYDALFEHFLSCLKETQQFSFKFISVNHVQQHVYGYNRGACEILEIRRIHA